MRLLVFGFGYSARAVWQCLGPKIETAWATTRTPDKHREIQAVGLQPLHFDMPSSPAASSGPEDPLLRKALENATHILVSIAPDPYGDPVLRTFRSELEMMRLRSVVYLSTVGVYGDHGGAWVDEDTKCQPVSDRARQRVAAEAEWDAFSRTTGVPVGRLRLSGIYGPGRGPMEKLLSGEARRIIKPGQVFNRIHVEDIAAAVEAAFACGAAGAFNVSDDEPAPPQDVLAFAAALLGLPLPPETPFETARLSPLARSFYAESKRVRNDKMKRELGAKLRFPTYREGLRAILGRPVDPVLI